MLQQKKSFTQNSSTEQESVTSTATSASNLYTDGGLSRVNQKRFATAAAKLFESLWAASWIPALLTRLLVGYFFMETGWAKIHNLDTFAMRFAQWGIPYPAFNAALSAYTEFVGGALTIIGLGMRFVSIPMIINMIVAIVTVKLKNVSGLDDFVELDEPLYALTFVWLFFSGAGWLSVDTIFKHIFASLLDDDGAQAAIGVSNAEINRSTLG
jgi:putative oxidoreductase